MTQLLAIDIGGTQIKYGLADDETLRPWPSLKSQASAGASSLVPQVLGVARKVASQVRFDGIAISTAGQVDAGRGLITYAGDTIPGYAGTDWPAELNKLFPGIPCTVENDVNCALLAELEPTDRYTVMLTIGTGIGGAMAIGQEVIHGAHNAMGEVGYLPLGATTFERCASTRALVQAVAGVYPQQLIDGPTVFTLAAQSPSVKAILDRYFDQLADGLRMVLLVFPADRLILGGGISENAAFIPQVTARLRPLLPPWLKSVKIQAAKYGNRAGMLGAARHWQQVNM